MRMSQPCGTDVSSQPWKAPGCGPVPGHRLQANPACAQLPALTRLCSQSCLLALLAASAYLIIAFLTQHAARAFVWRCGLTQAVLVCATGAAIQQHETGAAVAGQQHEPLRTVAAPQPHLSKWHHHRLRQIQVPALRNSAAQKFVRSEVRATARGHVSQDC